PAGLDAAAALARGERVSVPAYLGLDDARVGCALEDWAERADDPVLVDLCRRLVARRLFKAVGAPGGVPEAPLAAAAERTFGDRAQYYWAVDRAAQTAGEGDLHVVGHPRHGTILLGKLVEEMPVARQALTVRVLAAAELMPAFQDILCGS